MYGKMVALWKTLFLEGHSETTPLLCLPTSCLLHPEGLKAPPTGLKFYLHFPAAGPLFLSSVTSTSHLAPRPDTWTSPETTFLPQAHRPFGGLFLVVFFGPYYLFLHWSTSPA